MDTPTQPHQPTHISLCSGYGGIDLGLKSCIPDLRTVAYAEIEASAIELLLARMEGGQLDPAPIWSNLRTFPWGAFSDRVDLLSGGYPCQPFSSAGKRLGADDPRHLWPAIADGIRLLRPRVCFFENVEGHITLGLSSVLSDLEELGYQVSFGLFSAAEVGAPHQRKRVFVMAYRSGEGLQGDIARLLVPKGRQKPSRPAAGCSRSGGERGVANTNDCRSGEDWKSSEPRATGLEQSPCTQGRSDEGEAREKQVWRDEPDLADSDVQHGHGSLGGGDCATEGVSREHRSQERTGWQSGRADAPTVWPSRPGDVGDTTGGYGEGPGLSLRPGKGQLGGAGRCNGAWPSRPGEPQHWWEPPRVVANGEDERLESGEAERREESDWREGAEVWTELVGQSVGGAEPTMADTRRDQCERRSPLGEVPSGDDGEAGSCEAGSEGGEDEAGEWSLTESCGSGAEPAVVDSEGKRAGGGQELCETHGRQERTLSREPRQSGEILVNADCGRQSSSIDPRSSGSADCRGQAHVESPCGSAEPAMADSNDTIRCNGNIECERKFRVYEESGCFTGFAGDDQRQAQTGSPKAEPKVGGGTDGATNWVGYVELCVSNDNRTDELRMLGNGVVPATAARAFTILAADLAAGCPGRPERIA